MCGINGITNFSFPPKEAPRVIQLMNDSLRHRGPDGEGTFTSKDGRATLGARRLNIVDLEGGAQPFVLYHGNYEYAVAFNGEIYNHNAIRGELEKRGHSFRTRCDTEVLLRSYLEWGNECVHKFNGQFAFSVYDGKKNCVYVARDRVGIKPFYYTMLRDKTFLFSSEPKGILRHPDFIREPDNETIADFFLGTFTFPDGSASLDRSFFKRLYSLNPGTYGVLDSKGFRTTRYWDVAINKKDGSEDDFVKLLRSELENAIIIRIPEEVEFGTALSGGLDSSIVTAVVAAHQKRNLVSATIKFRDIKHNPDFEHAKLVALNRNIRHLATHLTAEDLISHIDPLVMAMDEPHDTIRQLGLFATYKTLHDEGCKVALVGEGADEFNLGYYYNYSGFYRDRKICNSSDTFRKILKKKVSAILPYFAKEFLDTVDFGKIIDYNVTNYYDACGCPDPIDKMEYFYAKKFLKYRLDANDRCGLAHSVEARVPFCDHNVVKVSLEVPNALNLKGGTEKHIFREAFRHLLPEKIVERRKYPLPESEELELHKLIARELDKNISSADAGVWKILNKEFIIGLNHRFKEKIEELEKTGKDASELTKDVSMGETADVRVKYIFAVLTLMRWFRLNFTLCGYAEAPSFRAGRSVPLP